MRSGDRSVSDHYGCGELERLILAALRAGGKDPDALTVDDLAPVDQLHVHGKDATLELARLTGLTPEMKVRRHPHWCAGVDVTGHGVDRKLCCEECAQPLYAGSFVLPRRLRTTFPEFRKRGSVVVVCMAGNALGKGGRNELSPSGDERFTLI